MSEGIVYALRERRVSSRFGNPNLLAAYLSLSLPFLLHMLVQSPHSDRRKVRIFRIIFSIGIILVLFTGILTRSRGGILSLAFGVGMFFLLHYVFSDKKEPGNRHTPSFHKKRILVILGMVAIFFLIFGMIQKATRSADIRGASLWERLFLTATIRERMYYLLTGWRIIKKTPLFGSGPAGYSLYYPLFRCFGAREAQYAHNFLVQVWAELGLVGIILFLGFSVFVVRAALRYPEKRYFILPALAGFLTFLFNSLFEYSFYHSSLFLDFCLCAGLILATSPAETQKIRGRKSLLSGLEPGYLQFALPLLLSVVLFFSLIFRPFMGATQKQFGDDAATENEQEKALGFYQKAVRYQPDHPWYEARVGEGFLKLGDTVKAEEHLQKALTLNPLSASLQDELAQLYKATYRFEDAEKMAKSATRAYPLKAIYHFHLAQILWVQGKKPDAQNAAREAIRLELDKDARKNYENFLKEIN